jgi:hypothetical protein
MNGTLKPGYKILKTNGTSFSIMPSEGRITVPPLLNFKEFLEGKEGYVVWSDKKQSLMFPGEKLKYTGKIILKSESKVPSEI